MTRKEFLEGIRGYGNKYGYVLNTRSVTVGKVPPLGDWLVECAEMYEGKINEGNTVIHGEVDIVHIPGEETVVGMNQ